MKPPPPLRVGGGGASDEYSSTPIPSRQKCDVKRHNQPMTLTELRYIVAVACEGRKRAHTEGGDRSPQQAVSGGDAINYRCAQA
jgi:hypothetical protein